MTILVLLYLGVGLFSVAIHYFKNLKEFNEDLDVVLLEEPNKEIRVILAIFIDVMTWPVALLLKIREKNND